MSAKIRRMGRRTRQNPSHWESNFVHIQTSVYHQTINKGSEHLEFFPMYSPLRPEAVLRTVSDF
jgi:hypothetical protein